MCRQSDALTARAAAARCLAETCTTRIGTSEALRATYSGVLDEGVPAEMLATLDKLEPEGGKNGAS